MGQWYPWTGRAWCAGVSAEIVNLDGTDWVDSPWTVGPADANGV